MKNISLIVVDPQVGFCSYNGSLASKYGNRELKPIRQAISPIQNALAESFRQHIITSEYTVGQFVSEDDQVLSKLCVPNITNDCDVIEEFSPFEFHSHTIKHEQDAFTCDRFFSYIEEDLKLGVKTFVVSGFLLEHCVRATALSLRKKLLGSNSDARVIVCSDLVASREEKYHNGVVTSAIKDLDDNGIMFTQWHTV